MKIIWFTFRYFFWIITTICLIAIFVISFPSETFPQTETHPFILYSPDEMQTIRERLIEEPYASWFERLLNETDSIVQSDISWDSPEVPEETKAYYAKLLAFAYAFSDISNINRTAYGTEAASSLYYIPSGDYPSYVSSDLTSS